MDDERSAVAAEPCRSGSCPLDVDDATGTSRIRVPAASRAREELPPEPLRENAASREERPGRHARKAATKGLDGSFIRTPVSRR